jgi:hypothetical protein
LRRVDGSFQQKPPFNARMANDAFWSPADQTGSVAIDGYLVPKTERWWNLEPVPVPARMSL